MSRIPRPLPLLLWCAGGCLAGLIAWQHARESRADRGPDPWEAVEPAAFRYAPSAWKEPAASAVRDLVAAATWLEPRRPAPSPEVEPFPPPESAETPPEPGPPGVEEGGPLAEDWEFVGGYFFEDDPLASRVVLRRKEPEDVQSRRAAEMRRRVLSRRGSASARRLAIARARARQLRADTVSISVGERFFRDDELELEFLIHSADAETLTYWIPGEPETLYALPRSQEPLYRSAARQGAGPQVLGGEEPPSEERRGHFRIRQPAREGLAGASRRPGQES